MQIRLFSSLSLCPCVPLPNAKAYCRGDGKADAESQSVPFRRGNVHQGFSNAPCAIQSRRKKAKRLSLTRSAVLVSAEPAVRARVHQGHPVEEAWHAGEWCRRGAQDRRIGRALRTLLHSICAGQADRGFVHVYPLLAITLFGFLTWLCGRVSQERPSKFLELKRGDTVGAFFQILHRHFERVRAMAKRL
jgi:hypothetical protein